MAAGKAHALAEAIRAVSTCNPDLAAKIRAVVSSGGRSDQLGIGIQISASIAKFNGDPKLGDAPVEVINLGQVMPCR